MTMSVKSFPLGMFYVFAKPKALGGKWGCLTSDFFIAEDDTDLSSRDTQKSWNPSCSPEQRKSWHVHARGLLTKEDFRLTFHNTKAHFNILIKGIGFLLKKVRYESTGIYQIAS